MHMSQHIPDPLKQRIPIFGIVMLEIGFGLLSIHILNKSKIITVPASIVIQIIQGWRSNSMLSEKASVQRKKFAAIGTMERGFIQDLFLKIVAGNIPNVQQASEPILEVHFVNDFLCASMNSCTLRQVVTGTKYIVHIIL
ncbi:hypothetical protein D3C74_382110 [compost metagenome]